MRAVRYHLAAVLAGVVVALMLTAPAGAAVASSHDVLDQSDGPPPVVEMDVVEPPEPRAATWNTGTGSMVVVALGLVATLVFAVWPARHGHRS